MDNFVNVVVAAFNQEKALVTGFLHDSEPSRRFVSSSAEE